MNKEEKKKLLEDYMKTPDFLVQAKKFQEVMTPFFEFAQQQAKALQPLVNALNENRPALEKFVYDVIKTSRNIIEFHNELADIHQQDKVFLPPFFNSHLTMPDIRKLFKNQKSAIVVYENFFLKEENIDELLRAWSENDYFKSRIPILRSALNAHLRGEHELSVPVFLNQLEGILIEILSVKKHSSFGYRLKEVFPNKKVEDLMFASLDGAETFIDVICNQIFEATGKIDRGSIATVYPNRHRIQHGLDVAYFNDKHFSVRCILVLDFLRAEEFSIRY